jgi:DNA-binding transcriptional ArsR family regulator
MAKFAVSADNQQIIDGVLAGMPQSDIAEILGIDPSAVYQRLGRLVDNGILEKTGRGKYRLAGEGKKQEVAATRSATSPAASVQKRVEIPPYMKSRVPVTVFVERSPFEIENVLRIELQIGGQWLPLLISGDIRICIGDDIPRWGAPQETYSEVTAYRLTFANGARDEYPHASNKPFTVIGKE